MRQVSKAVLVGVTVILLFFPLAAAETTELSVEAPFKVLGDTKAEFESGWLVAWAPEGRDVAGDEFSLSASSIPFAEIKVYNYTTECTVVDFSNPPTFSCQFDPEASPVEVDYADEGPLSDVRVEPLDDFVFVARLGQGIAEEAPVTRGTLEVSTIEEGDSSTLSALESRRYIYATAQSEIWSETECGSRVCQPYGVRFEKDRPYLELENGLATVSGGSHIYIFNGKLQFHDLSKPDGRTTELMAGRTAYTDMQNGIPTRQVVTVTWIVLTDWTGGYDIQSSLPMRAFSQGSEVVQYKGLMDFKDPTGSAAINGNLTEFVGEDTEIAGEMTVMGIDAGSHRSGGTTLTFQVLNDAAPPIPPTPPPIVEDEGFARGVVAATAATSSLGLAAYFWPRLKWLATVPLIPLYTRIAKDEVLEHGKREEIYNLIREEPGIHAHEISSRAQIGWGTTVYHLRMLETNKLVTAQYSGRYKRFFANTGGFSQNKDMYAALKNPTTAKIAQEILRNPGITQKDISKAIGITPSLVSWHIGKLEEANLVRRVKEGRLARHYAGDGWKTLNLQLPGTPIGGEAPPGERGAA
ncbi:MAG: winged helix-turn-helix transcriptional regulator [Euryarchaeota archaeon]|nr:winged helix-turn-helix transcriptional regulator [Euryarchaeota archaeon]